MSRLRTMVLVTALSFLFTAPAWAASAVGFHSTKAPVGARLQFGEYYAVDLGVGFKNQDDKDTWTADIGLPVTLKRWDQVKVHFRPGLIYSESEGTVLARTLSAEIEGEAFIVKDFSVSASFGVSRDNLNGESSFRTTGGEFTNVGFHFYIR